MITCSRIPNRTCLPSAAAARRIQSTFSATAAGGSPQVRYTSAWRAATGPAAAELPPKYNGGTGFGSVASEASSTWMCSPSNDTVCPSHSRRTTSRNSSARA